MKYIKISYKDFEFKDFISIDNILCKIVEINSPYESQCEVHENYIDIFIPLEGFAKIFISDDYYGGNEIKKGEIRDCSINNYQIEYISKGDILIIAQKCAHKVVIENDVFKSILIKVKNL